MRLLPKATVLLPFPGLHNLGRTVSEKVSANDMPGPQTHAESARVQGGYESLDVNGTKKAYEELDGVLDKLATTAVQTLDQMVPYLAEMQSLLSQRGAKRKKVLRQAALPGWTQWARAHASRLDRSLRTIQDRIRQFRGPHASRAAASTSETKRKSNDERLRLDSRQQAALVKAQVATNELIAALENGGDWQTALAACKKVAVSPEKQDSFVNALNQEPDWKSILTQLVNALEPCGDMLPALVKEALHAAQDLLGGKPGEQQSPSQRPTPADPEGVGPQITASQGVPEPAAAPLTEAKQGRIREARGVPSKTSPAPSRDEAAVPMAGASAGKASAAVPVKWWSVPRKPPSSAKVKMCPAALGPEEDRCETAATSYLPGTRQGNFTLNENGRWDHEPEQDMRGGERNPQTAAQSSAP